MLNDGQKLLSSLLDDTNDWLIQEKDTLKEIEENSNSIREQLKRIGL